ncbi:hypothetical protein FVE85_5836 [Porphyridium purpureum]|uniref:Uncharacterized protein n=1 Tax=Porphyridium purpureum TaxID=35688 RepID=A0A5J4Z302_PORPP|nr:hypothetical protein FVE85_5836 [Porphyridium purpureum]|eukprot:POR3930..scf295_1
MSCGPIPSVRLQSSPRPKLHQPVRTGLNREAAVRTGERRLGAKKTLLKDKVGNRKTRRDVKVAPLEHALEYQKARAGLAGDSVERRGSYRQAPNLKHNSAHGQPLKWNHNN